MGKGKLLPSANPKLLNRSSPNLNGVIMSWTFTTKNKLGSIGPKVFALRTDEIYTPPVRNLLHIFGSWTRLQASPLGRLLRLVRQMTRFCARRRVAKLGSTCLMSLGLYYRRNDCQLLSLKEIFLPKRLCLISSKWNRPKIKILTVYIYQRPQTKAQTLVNSYSFPCCATAMGQIIRPITKIIILMW